MAIIRDPAEREIFTLNAMVDFENRSVLEIGCGEGRLTWLYAQDCAKVVAIDPIEEDIAFAREDTPDELKDHVHFLQTTIEDYAPQLDGEHFDIAIFSWSL
jgi:2-polyprenyl-3-methyl-5-hydroxy-6-metoxy-1,4-benzoquinol methylase